MSTAVFSNTLNLSASGAAANLDTGRSAANSTSSPSFSNLLRGQKQEKTPENVTPAECTAQPQLTDAAASPEFAAIIAALANGIAGEIAEDASMSEASFRDASTPPQPPATAGSLSTRTAALTDSAMQNGVERKSDADSNGKNGQRTAPNTSAELTGRTPTDSIASSQTAASLNRITNAANAVSIIPREGNDTQTAPTETTTKTADISIPNPPRLFTQPSAPLPQFTLPAGAGQTAWAEEIGNRVMWMLGRAESRAELILTPPLLGKVEISIHLSGDQSTAQFLASSQSARESLEQALPRLRELLAQAGISLGEASVNTSAEGRAQDAENVPHLRTHPFDVHGGDGDAAITVQNGSRLNKGLIDTFA